jgi:hypothetical protein
MGAKTALLAFTDGDLRPTLSGAVRSDPAEVIDRVRQLHPGYEVTPIGDGSLGDDIYPPDDTSYATVLAGAELFCDRRLVRDRPSLLPPELLRAAAGRRIIMHAMHSASDWMCFAVWENGELVRSLSLSANGGIAENIGEPYDFEVPFWAGEAMSALELGEVALRALFGFILEGRPAPDDVDPDDVHLHGFRVADPTGREQADREAVMARALQSMGPPRRYRMMPDGTLQEID